MNLVLRSAFHLSRLRDAECARVALLVDSQAGVRSDTVMSLLHPWRSWLEIAELHTAPAVTEERLEGLAGTGITALAAISERAEFVVPVERFALSHGIAFVPCGYETASPRDAAFLHEVTHHHYELGGLNEWDGAPAQYSTPVLQTLSAANCDRHFPMYVAERLQARHRAMRRPVEALDIGCGPVSRLRWGMLQGLLHVTGVDPLLDAYAVLLRYHGLDLLHGIGADRAIADGAEALEDHIPANSIEFAYSCNALDHVEDPRTVIGQIGRVLRPGGVLALEFATREGSRQDWLQLHQFDLYWDLRYDELMCQRQDGRAEALIPPGVGLQLDEIVVADADYTVAVLSASQ